MQASEDNMLLVEIKNRERENVNLRKKLEMVATKENIVIEKVIDKEMALTMKS
jgi:hypothetical protein